MIFIIITQEDQVVLIDNEEDELNNGDFCEHCERRDDIDYFISNKRIINQVEIPQNCLTLRKVRTMFVHLFLKMVYLPISIYSFYIKWKLGIENDFIIVN